MKTASFSKGGKYHFITIVEGINSEHVCTVPSIAIMHKGLQESKHTHTYIYDVLSHAQLSVAPWTIARQLLCPWDSLGKNTGVGCHVLLQGIFLIHGSNPQQASLPQGSLYIYAQKYTHICVCMCV